MLCLSFTTNLWPFPQEAISVGRPGKRHSCKGMSLPPPLFLCRVLSYWQALVQRRRWAAQLRSRPQHPQTDGRWRERQCGRGGERRGENVVPVCSVAVLVLPNLASKYTCSIFAISLISLKPIRNAARKGRLEGCLIPSSPSFPMLVYRHPRLRHFTSSVPKGT